MYLSLLTLNPRSRRVMSECADPYQMHRTLSKAFTQGLDDEAGKAALAKARPLFRVEQTPPGETKILVQSHLKPQWWFLDGIGYLQQSAQTKIFEPHFESGQTFVFRLRANPTKADAGQRTEKRHRGKCVGIFKETERRDWLIRCAALHGFSITIAGELKDGTPIYDLRLTDEKAFRATPEGPDKSTRAVLSAALFEGRLTVTDPAAFTKAVQNGIGRGKAFGFGLLSLRRA
jgi:CRISPR system Cascade subunit CasE